jgi:NADH pyrophosphatase NudC (nudix superfamily)
MSIEAMKLALFALDIVKIHYTQNRHVNEAITALKERLADPMREVQRLGQEIEQEPVAKYCCRLCYNKSGSLLLDRMILCSECGNKRCPKATNHELQCTNSNAPNQAGSIYNTPPQRTEQEPVAWVCCGSGEKHDIDFYEDDVNALPVGTMLYTHPPQRTEQNFCPRCGKRTNDIHTCTPPKETT